MNILIIGSGGREHALACSVRASPLCDRLYCVPGNAGMADIAHCRAIDPTDERGILDFCQAESIDFVIIGPEQPLVDGLADTLRSNGIKAFGPGAQAARLEGSKGWMKDFCRRHHIPTAAYQRFSDAQAALDYVEMKGVPLVIKTDGLAAGKGVSIATEMAMAQCVIRQIMEDHHFGAAGRNIIIEEYLEGEEVSFFALLDGEYALPLAAAQDHKRVGEGDQGPNTGGMGSYSPVPGFDETMQDRVMAEIIQPVLTGMQAEGHPYKGILFAGLMIVDGNPQLLEYNIRFGDPECQALMMRLRSDLLTALLTAEEGGLSHFDLQWSKDSALCVVMAANGYPGPYQKGSRIQGVDERQKDTEVEIFHAGTYRDQEGILRAEGGRVLGITALAQTLAGARSKAYHVIEAITWPEGFYRRDIGEKAAGKAGASTGDRGE